MASSQSTGSLEIDPLLSSTVIIGAADAKLYQMMTPAKPGTIDIGQAQPLVAQSPIWAARGKAIQAYATLEQSLCMLMSDLADMSRESALTIFFKITSYGSRNSIIEKLIKTKHDQKFNLFWNSYLKELHKIDVARNEIVHWLSVANLALDVNGNLLVGVNLAHPSNMHPKTIEEYKTPSDLLLFADKCFTFSLLCNCFVMETSPPPNHAPRGAWLQIFQQPLIYPLPADHLLFQRGPAPDSQP